MCYRNMINLVFIQKNSSFVIWWTLSCKFRHFGTTCCTLAVPFSLQLLNDLEWYRYKTHISELYYSFLQQSSFVFINIGICSVIHFCYAADFLSETLFGLSCKFRHFSTTCCTLAVPFSLQLLHDLEWYRYKTHIWELYYSFLQQWSFVFIHIGIYSVIFFYYNLDVFGHI